MILQREYPWIKCTFTVKIVIGVLLISAGCKNTTPSQHRLLKEEDDQIIRMVRVSFLLHITVRFSSSISFFPKDV